MLKLLLVTVFLIFLNSEVDGIGTVPKKSFRTMTMNIWNCGTWVKDGLEKVVKHIKTIDPDVVALQEVEYADCFKKISTLLGPDWYGIERQDPTPYPNDALFSKWPIYASTITQTEATVGARIRVAIDEKNYRNFTVFSAHLQYKSYGPEAACNKLVTDASQIMAGELGLGLGEPGRIQNIESLLLNPLFQDSLSRTDEEPLFVMGDLNTASHLDWTEQTKATHCGWSFDWPATKMLTEKAGMIDVYRALHPDPVKDPGNTWSVVVFSDLGWDYTIQDSTFDRIDYTFYQGKNLKPVSSKVYYGSEPIRPKPVYGTNDWPSDHAAVVSEFAML